MIFIFFCCLQKSGLLWVLWVMEGMWMAEGAGVQGQGPGWGGHAALRGMWPCLPRCWGGAACPRAAAVLLLMLAWLSAASFTLSYTRGIFFLLATALVFPGDSSSNNHGFVLCLCWTPTIHQLQLAWFDVFGEASCFDSLFSLKISLIE